MVEPRLTGFAWGNWNGATIAVSRSDLQSWGPLLSAAARITQRAQASPHDADVQALLGVSRLLLADPDAAVRSLEASVEGGASERVLNDLSASYLHRGQRRDAPEEVVRAMDIAGRAARLHPGETAPLFNVALCLEYLGPPSVAAAAWDDYLRADSSSDWAREARVRRDALRRQVPDPSLPIRPAARDDDTEVDLALLGRQRLRERLADTWLVRWADAIEHEDPPAAAAALAVARRMSFGLFQRDGDRHGVDLVAAIDETAEPSVRLRTARAVLAAQRAEKLLVDSNRVAAARDLLSAARHDAGGRSAALDAYIEYWFSLTTWYTDTAAPLERTLEELKRRTTHHGYRFLAARTQVFLGSVLQRGSRYSDAVAAYRLGIEALAQLEETESEAGARMLLATALHEHGDWSEAWRNERAALARLDSISGYARRHNVLREAVRLGIARQQPDAAAAYLPLLLEDAKKWNDAGALLESSMLAGRVHTLRGDQAKARAALTDAERALHLIPDNAFRESYTLALATFRAEVLMREAPVAAAEQMRQVIDAATRSGTLFRRARAYLLLGRALAATSDTSGARAAWLRGIEVLEDEASAVRDEQLRISRSSEIWALYEELIGLLAQPQPKEALRVAERGRARALLDSLARTQHSSALDAAPVAEPAATILYYATLPDRLLIWVLSGKDAVCRPVQISSAELGRLVTRTLYAINEGQDPSALLNALHDVLVRPVHDLLVAGRSLVIIPDGHIASVPFAALRSRTGRLLIEDHELTLAPSLAVFRHATSRLDQSATTAEPRVLVVGDPSFISNELPALPGARQEALDVAKYYRRTTVLIGGEALRERFERELAGQDILHFAGHAVTDPDYPSRSFLALAGKPPAAMLTPDRISASDLRHVRLVVLSGCSTATGGRTRGEGVLSLARPFHAAGVPLVAATLWPIDDGVGDLVVEFHRRLRTGDTPAASLRSVQLEYLRRHPGPDVRRWAAFVLIGGAEQPRLSPRTGHRTGVS
jgi:CHAT domain-containing protein